MTDSTFVGCSQHGGDNDERHAAGEGLRLATGQPGVLALRGVSHYPSLHGGTLQLHCSVGGFFPCVYTCKVL